jgi:hypothetical protein
MRSLYVLVGLLMVVLYLTVPALAYYFHVVPQATCHDPSGFLLGWVHGATSVVVWFWSLFFDTIPIFDSCNNGQWYTTGFLVGIGSLLGGSSSSSSKS